MGNNEYFLFNENTGDYEGMFDDPKLAGECLADWQDDDTFTPEVADRYGLYVLRITNLYGVRFLKADTATARMREAYRKVYNDCSYEQEVDI